MYLLIKCRDFYNFWPNQIHAELLKPDRFVFCLINMVLPSMLCLPSFLTISYRFIWCFRMFLLAFLRFSLVFLLFSLSVSLVSYFRFWDSIAYFLNTKSRRIALHTLRRGNGIKRDWYSFRHSNSNTYWKCFHNVQVFFV